MFRLTRKVVSLRSKRHIVVSSRLHKTPDTERYLEDSQLDGDKLARGLQSAYFAVLCHEKNKGDHQKFMHYKDMMTSRCPKIVPCNVLMSIQFKENDFAGVANIFHSYVGSVPPTSRVYSLLVSSLVHMHQTEEALTKFWEMSTLNIIPYNTAVTDLLHHLCTKNKINEAMKIFDKFCTRKNGPSMEVILDYLCKNKQTKVALEMLAKMKDNMLKPNEFFYTSIIQALTQEAVGGDQTLRVNIEKTVVDLFNEAESTAKVDINLFNTVINFYCKIGKLDGTQKYFDHMKSSGIHPDTVTWNILIDFYCRVDRGEEALQILHNMKTQNITPSHVTYSTIIQYLFRKKNCNKLTS
jgi:leucine-rich PPR motif-containing protein